MATSNVTATKTWAKLAADTVDGFTASSRFQQEIEYATTAADAAPAATLEGHALRSDQAATRQTLLNGFVWYRVAPRSNLSTAVVVLDV
jgi:hypothetical protein